MQQQQGAPAAGERLQWLPAVLTSFPSLMFSPAFCTTPPSTSAAPAAAFDSSFAHWPTPLPTSFNKSPWSKTKTRWWHNTHGIACMAPRTQQPNTPHKQGRQQEGAVVRQGQHDHNLLVHRNFASMCQLACLLLTSNKQRSAPPTHDNSMHAAFTTAASPQRLPPSPMTCQVLTKP